jgi:hypothetical protein
MDTGSFLGLKMALHPRGKNRARAPKSNWNWELVVPAQAGIQRREGQTKT